jgi:hypothetical protein
MLIAEGREPTTRAKPGNYNDDFELRHSLRKFVCQEQIDLRYCRSGGLTSREHIIGLEPINKGRQLNKDTPTRGRSSRAGASQLS